MSSFIKPSQLLDVEVSSFIPVFQNEIQRALVEEPLDSPVTQSDKSTLDQILKAVNSSASPDLILLVGEAGIGKTTLLQSLVREVNDKYAASFLPVEISIVASYPSYVEELDPRWLLTAILNRLASTLGVPSLVQYARVSLQEELQLVPPSIESSDVVLRSRLSRPSPQILASILKAIRLDGKTPLIIIDDFDVLASEYQLRIFSLVSFLAAARCAKIVLSARPRSIGTLRYEQNVTSLYPYLVIRIPTPELLEILRFRLARISEVLPGLSQLIESIARLKIGTLGFIEYVSNGSTRASFLAILKIIESPVIEPYLRALRAQHTESLDKKNILSESDILTAFFVGSDPTFRSDRRLSNNLFNLFPVRSNTDILIGPFLLAAFRDQAKEMRSQAEVAVASGFDSELVFRCLDSLVECRLLATPEDDKALVITKKGMLYLKLLDNPTYLALAAQDTLLPTEIAQLIARRAPLSFDDLRYNVRLFGDYLVDLENQIITQRKTAITDNLSLKSLISSAKRAVGEIATDILTSIDIRITDRFIPMTLVSDIFSVFAVLAGKDADELVLADVASGSFLASIKAKMSIVRKVAKTFLKLKKIFLKYSLIDKHGRLLEAQAEKIFAEARLIDANTTLKQVEAFSKLLKAVEGVDNISISTTERVLLDTKVSRDRPSEMRQ